MASKNPTTSRTRDDIKYSTSATSSSDFPNSDGPQHTIISKWKSKALQFGPVKGIVSTVAPEHVKSADGKTVDQPRSWRTTLIRFGPLSGFFCMFLAIASIIASLGILAGSDGDAEAKWSAPPATYLAVFTAIANLSMRYAAIQGVVIAWWIKATRGSTLEGLHCDWRSGTSIRGALTAGRRMGLLGLACIFSTLVVIDGPLLQHSSRVVSAPIVNEPVSIGVLMAQELPTGFTGSWFMEEKTLANKFSSLWNNSIPANNGSITNYRRSWGYVNPFDVAKEWLDNTVMSGHVFGCPDQATCIAKIRAPALDPTICNSHYLPINYEGPVGQDMLKSQYAPPLEQNLFMVDATLDLQGGESIDLITGYSIFDECHGTLNYTICTLEPAIGEYEVTIQGQDILDINSMRAPALVALANNTAVNYTYDAALGGHPSTLAGIVQIISLVWRNLITQYKDGNDTLVISSGADVYLRYQEHPYQKCQNFGNPLDDVINSLNTFMFRMGGYAAKYNWDGEKTDEAYLRPRMDPDLSVNTTYTGHIDGYHNVFRTNYWFFLGAALVEIVCIMFILPTYWNFWKLGRPVSFSPLELAKAFESPMLSNSNSNSTGRDLARAKDDFDVRYGTITSGEKTKIAFGSPSVVTSPSKGMRFEV